MQISGHTGFLLFSLNLFISPTFSSLLSFSFFRRGAGHTCVGKASWQWVSAGRGCYYKSHRRLGAIFDAKGTASASCKVRGSLPAGWITRPQSVARVHRPRQWKRAGDRGGNCDWPGEPQASNQHGRRHFEAVSATDSWLSEQRDWGIMRFCSYSDIL